MRPALSQAVASYRASPFCINELQASEGGMTVIALTHG